MTTGTAPTTHGGTVAERIGARLLATRAERGWSTAELALRTGVGRDVVADVESGTRLPTVAILVRLATALHVTPGELLPSAPERPRGGVHLPMSDARDAAVAQVIGAPGDPTRTYLVDARAGEDDGGFGAHPGDELLVVIEGEVVHSALGRDDVIVRAGGSHVVDTSVPHGIRALDAGPARFLLVCTDPDPDPDPGDRTDR